MYRLPLYFDAMETWILIQPHSCTVRLQSRDFGLSRIQNNANLQIMVRTTEQTNVPTSVFQKAYRNTVACYIWPVSQPTKYPKHTGLSGFRSVLTALSKNCVAHFFARRFPAVILVKKSVREHIGLRCRFCQASWYLWSLRNSVSSCQRWLADCCRIGAIASLVRPAKCFRETLKQVYQSMTRQRTKVFQLRLTPDEAALLKEKSEPYGSVSHYIRCAVAEYSNIHVRQRLELIQNSVCSTGNSGTNFPGQAATWTSRSSVPTSFRWQDCCRQAMSVKSCFRPSSKHSVSWTG